MKIDFEKYRGEHLLVFSHDATLIDKALLAMPLRDGLLYNRPEGSMSAPQIVMMGQRIAFQIEKQLVIVFTQSSLILDSIRVEIRKKCIKYPSLKQTGVYVLILEPTRHYVAEIDVNGRYKGEFVNYIYDPQNKLLAELL